LYLVRAQARPIHLADAHRAEAVLLRRGDRQVHRASGDERPKPAVPVEQRYAHAVPRDPRVYRHSRGAAQHAMYQWRELAQAAGRLTSQIALEQIVGHTPTLIAAGTDRGEYSDD